MSRLPLPTEEELETRLRRGEIVFPPLSLIWTASPAKEIDGILRITWKDQTVPFAVQCKRATNPKSLADAAEKSRQRAGATKMQPLIVVPFLDEEALDTLEAKEVSGIDQCGNGLVIAPGEWFIRRAGSPNLFRPDGVIKNVYRNTSSVVARLFLAKPAFDSVQEALEEIRRRGGRVTLPTVSKVCKELENDLVIERSRGGVTKLRLIQPEKLLAELAANFSSPTVSRRVTGKLRGIEAAELRKFLKEWAEKSDNQVVLSGASSVSAYAVMARSGVEEYYCSDVFGAVRALGERFQETDRFAAVSFLETRDDTVYFDCRDNLTASPVQTFLELSSGDKRDQETADQVRKLVLNAGAPAGRK
jgi:hypothetical protein